MNKKSKLISIIVSLAILASMVTNCNLNCSFSVTAVDSKMSNLRESKERLEIKQKELRKALGEVKDDIASKEAYQEKLESLIKETEAQIDECNEKITALNTQKSAKEAEIARIEQEMDLGYKELGEKLRVIQKNIGGLDWLFIILTSSNFDEMLDRDFIIEKLGEETCKLIDELKRKEDIVKSEKIGIETAKKEIEETMIPLEEAKSNLDRLIGENAEIIAELQKKRSQVMSQQADVESEKQKVEDSIIELLRQSGQAASIYRKGRLIWPCALTGTGDKWGAGRNHKGWDIIGPRAYGAAIYAAADGVVAVANSTDSWGSGWGYHILINHGEGFATRYAHCSRLAVYAGQHVKAGQIIGYVGNTGHSYGAHLHFETLKNGVRYDPAVEFGA